MNMTILYSEQLTIRIQRKAVWMKLKKNKISNLYEPNFSE